MTWLTRRLVRAYGIEGRIARAAHGRLAHADSSTANATEDGGQVSGHEVEAGTESDVTEPIDIMPTPIDIAPAPADAA